MLAKNLTFLSGRCCRRRAWRACPDHTHLSRRQRAHALASCAVAMLFAGRRAKARSGLADARHHPVINAGSSSIKFQLFAVAGHGLEGA
jgi:hypothetical protein